MIAQGVRLNLSIIDITTASGASPLIRLYTLKGLSAVGAKRPDLECVKRWVRGDKSCEEIFRSMLLTLRAVHLIERRK